MLPPLRNRRFLRVLRSGLIYVKTGLVAAFVKSFSSGSATLLDSSGNGNDMVLNTGRGFTTDAVNDKGINADLSAIGGQSGQFLGVSVWVKPIGSAITDYPFKLTTAHDGAVGLKSGVTLPADTWTHITLGDADAELLEMLNAILGIKLSGFSVSGFNEFYAEDGTNDGRPQYTFSGSQQILWSNSFARWVVLNAFGAPVYSSAEDVATPDLVTQWQEHAEGYPDASGSASLEVAADSTLNEVVLGWDGTNFYNCSFSDFKLTTSAWSAGVDTIAHWRLIEHADETADGLDDLVCCDSAPLNSDEGKDSAFHGVHSGCAGFSGEGTIPQVAGMNYNSYRRFLGTERVELSALSLASRTVEFTFLYTSGNDQQLLQWTSVVDDRLLVATVNSQNLGSWDFIVQSLEVDGTELTKFSWNGLVAGAFYTVVAVTDASGELTSATLNGVAGSAPGSAKSRFNRDQTTSNIRLGMREGGLYPYAGIIYEFLVDGSLRIKGYGENPWVDQIGSNDGIEAGTFTNTFIAAADANDANDAQGNAISLPRINTHVLNLNESGGSGLISSGLGGGRSLTFAYYHETGVDREIVTADSYTIEAYGDDVASDLVSASYYVNGAAGIALSPGWNIIGITIASGANFHPYEVLATSGLHFTYIDPLDADGHLQNYNAFKNKYGLS